MGFARAVGVTTLVSGTLDLLSAFVFAGMKGATPLGVLRSVASGPFGDHLPPTLGWSLAGLFVHYALMTVMVTVFMLAAERIAAIRAHPALAGMAYGFGIYLVMYCIVLPARFPAVFPQTGAWQVTNALISHLLCVGLSMGLVGVRQLRR